MQPIFHLHWYLAIAREYPGIHKSLHELAKEHVMTQVEWRQLQAQRLRNLLIFAQHNVPYYKDVFQKLDFNPLTVKLPDEMERLPILTKAIVRGNIHMLRADNMQPALMFENTTGGSTGVPLKFYQDINYKTIAMALDTFVRGWWGILPYDRTAFAWGADREFHELSLKEKVYEWRKRSRAINAFRMTEESLVAFCNMLTEWRPPYLMGYSSALETMAKCAQRHNIKLHFKAIRSTAEMLWPHQRKLIEETFNSPVYNFYGSREVNNIAAECPEGRRMHMISTYRYVEIVNDLGKCVPTGEVGNIVVTDLTNFAMPMIRYRNEDLGRMAQKPCQCGRPSLVLEDIIGRSTDIIRTPRGDIIHGEFFTHLFYGADNIKQFQVHQKTLNNLIVRCVADPPPSAAFIQNIVNKIQARLGQEVLVDFDMCDNIPVPGSGKHRFTISDVTQ